MTRTVEVSDPAQHFTAGAPLTAVVGTRFPTADGYGQLVFVWHDRALLGWDSSTESIAITRLWSSPPGVVAATCPHYAPADPPCCPSLPAETVAYTGSGTALRAGGPPPRLTGARVQLTP